MVTGAATALFASACVVTTDDPDDDGNGGASGANNVAGAAGAKAGAGGASAGAAGAPAGAGGEPAVTYVCDEDPTAPGTPNPTCAAPEGSENDCTACIETKCCAEYKECYGTDPGNQCGWGGPNDEGELACMQLCAQKALIAQGVLEEDEINGCIAACGTKKSKGSTLDCDLIGGSTSSAFTCLKDKCMVECIGEP